MVFTAADAVAAAQDGRDVILVRPFTDAEDVAGFHAAKGILTSEGGKASHAALVARGMGRPAVVGADAVVIDLAAKTITVNGTKLHEGDRIAIDGTKGQVTVDDVPLVEATVDENFEQVLQLGRRDARPRRAHQRRHARGRRPSARELGAQGIGLCRTEHMFMAEDRQPKMRAMIMADTREDRKQALADLLPLQQEDFEGHLRGDGRAAGDRPPARPAAARVPAQPRRPVRPGRARADRGDRRPARARAAARAGARDLRGEPDARHPRRAGWGSSTPRSTRCRSTRSSAPPRPPPSRPIPRS